MSHIDYMVNKVKGKVQDLADSVEKRITMIIGITAVGPVVIFVLSTLITPYLVLLIPLLLTMNVLILRRVFLGFVRVLTNELLRYMDGEHDDMVSLLKGSRLLTSLVDLEDSRRWFYILNVINDSSNDLLGSLVMKDAYGELDLDSEALAKYLISINSSLNKLITVVISRGMRTIMISYYILLYSIPTVAKTLMLLNIHWNPLFIILLQLLMFLIMFISIKLIRKTFDININQVLFFTASMGAILMSLLLFA